MCIGGRFVPREGSNLPVVDIHIHNDNVTQEYQCMESIISLFFIPTRSNYREWYRVWRSLPSLNLDITVAYRIDSDGSRFWATRDRFMEIVNCMINVRQESQTPLIRFRLVHHYCDDEQPSADVGNWVRMAARLGCQELDLNFLGRHWFSTHSRSRTWPLPDHRDVPMHFFFRFADIENCRVASVSLRSCDFIPDGTSHLDSLTSISLHEMEYVRDVEISHLIGRCKNLRHFTLSEVSFYSTEILNIHCATLEYLNLSRRRLDEDYEGLGLMSLSIEAHALSSLTLCGFHMESYALDVPNLKEANVEVEYPSSPITSQNLELINRNLYGVGRLRFHNLPQGCIDEQYKNLTYLELITGYNESDILGLSEFLRASPLLGELLLEHKHPTTGYHNFWNDNDAYKKFGFEIPSLKKVTLKGYMNTANEKYVVEVFKTSAELLKGIWAYHDHHQEAQILLWAPAIYNYFSNSVSVSYLFFAP